MDMDTNQRTPLSALVRGHGHENIICHEHGRRHGKMRLTLEFLTITDMTPEF